jgi:DNA-binding response OmpR family regulator
MAEKIDFSVVRFLVVDHNQMMQEMVRDILLMLEAQTVFRAFNIDQARRVLREETIDVLVTERNIGPESGLDLLRYIRHHPDSPNRVLPVVMLTADSEEEYVVEARDCGVTEFLAKPFSIEGLYRRLVAAIARPRPFINTDGYFGPDRRRRQIAFGGPDRRAPD